MKIKFDHSKVEENILKFPHFLNLKLHETLMIIDSFEKNILYHFYKSFVFLFNKLFFQMIQNSHHLYILFLPCDNHKTILN